MLPGAGLPDASVTNPLKYASPNAFKEISKSRASVPVKMILPSPADVVIVLLVR